MTTAEMITAALAALSLAVASTALWRTFAVEQPLAWLTIEATDQANCWIAYLNLRNRSQVELKPNAVWVNIDSVTEPRKQRFELLEYQEQRPIDLNKARHAKMPVSPTVIPPGKTGKLPVVLIRSPLSTTSQVRFYFSFYILKARSAYRIRTLRATLPEGNLTIHLGG